MAGRDGPAEEVIHEFMEGSKNQNVEIHLPDQWKGVRRGRTQDEGGGQGCPGGEEAERALRYSLPLIALDLERFRKDPNDLLGNGRRISPIQRKKARQQDI